MKKLIPSLVLILFTYFLIAQNKIQIQPSSITNRCYTQEKYNELIKSDPSLLEKRKVMEVETQQWINENQKKNKAQSIITIPVVVHVVYRTSPQNISDAQIQSQIDVLNEDYRKLNADAANVPSAFIQYAADAEIEFCLASLDPNGVATTGITRTQTTIQDIGSTSSYYYTSQGGDDIWDRDQYMNIWICEISGGTLGFAYYPGSAPADYDGIVIQSQYFGTTGTVSAPYHLGRTATHEVGHWLNLAHIWGDDSGACTGTDDVGDTPNQADNNFGCPTFPLTDACTGSSPGVMFMDYMDYTDDDCMNMFTQGQASRMQSAINLYRSTLITSNGCGGTSTLNAKFTASNTSVSTGSSIDFTDQSTGSPTSWSWTFSGGTPSTSNSQNPSSIIYSSDGTYDVTLIVFDGSSYDTLTKTAYITVYSASSCDTITNVPSGGTLFTYTSQGLGYISGHNSYEDMSKADYFSVYPNSSDLTSVLIYFTHAEYASSTSKVTVNVLDNSGSNGSPGSILASKDVLISDIATDVQNANYTLVTFDSPVTIASAFYVGVQFYYGSTDTVVVGTTKDGEVTTNTAWEQWYDATWHTYTSAYFTDLAHFMYPVFCSAVVSSVPTINTSSLSLFVSPNPFKEQLEVQVLNNQMSGSNNLKISVYNMLGEKIGEQIYNSSMKYIFPTIGFSTGIYYLHVNNGLQEVVTKIMKVE